MNDITLSTTHVNYQCTVVKIKEIFNIEGADKIKRTTVEGSDVVIGLDTKIGDKMLYFCSGIQLDPDYCKYNNLLTDPELNRNKTKGYISHKQFRVKAIKLKNVISDGILLPITSLEYLFPNVATILQIGDTFNKINDFTLCKKYFVPLPQVSSNISKTSRKVKVSRLLEGQFNLHVDTENLRRNISNLQLTDTIGIHYKKHGISVVIANIPVKRNLKWYEKLLRYIIPIVDTEYDTIYSSRNVIKNNTMSTTSNSYYSTDIWGDVVNEVKHTIPKNYTLYGEIVGYTSAGASIQKNYDYGCVVGEHKFYVYRITVVNIDGVVLELTDLQIQEFCKDNHLKYNGTFLFHGTVTSLLSELQIEPSDAWQQELLDKLEKKYTNKNCVMCNNKVPEEGIVLRVERLNKYIAYKLKSTRFILMESDNQEMAVPDIESSQS